MSNSINKIQFVEGGVCAPIGYKASGIHCGIRRNGSKLDLGLLVSECECSAAAVYTQNKVFGAPITVTRLNIASGKARAVICNSGNANTCNSDGVDKAIKMCEVTAKALNIGANEIIVASTGVIGQPLPIDPIINSIDELASKINRNGSDAMANAIMTTDTYKKEFAVKFVLGGKVCHIGAIAKGSGMIHPNMATMLSFIVTDVAITTEMLDKALKSVVNDTVNMVSVDGDTSTNDMMSIMANGMAGNSIITEDSSDIYAIFVENLHAIAVEIARNLARDGEGATKLIECHVNNAPTTLIAKIIGKSVIQSNLLKCALFAADANWGRILCAIGYADADFDISKVDVVLKSNAGAVAVCRAGSGVPFSEDDARKVLLEPTIIIDVNINSGDGAAIAYGCDLTYDYVKINANYRS